MITVAKVLELPSMYGATILAGQAGISNPVESVTVLEYGRVTNTLDKLFSQTEFQGNEILISSLATIADDVEAQCENIRRYHAVGCVALILFNVGIILPKVDERLIACCNELDFVLITMPADMTMPKYSDVIGDIYHAIFKDRQADTNFASMLIRRFSKLPSEQRNISTMLRMLSNHVQASIIATDYEGKICNIACWPQSLSPVLSKELGKQLCKMLDDQPVKIELTDGIGYLQHCPKLLEGADGFNLYTFKYNEILSRELLLQASEFVQLYSHIWNKDLGKFVTSELVRAIIDDDPLKMRRLSELFHISVAELNQMWVFSPSDHSEPRPELLRKYTEYFSDEYSTVLAGCYESNMVIFTHAPRSAMERDVMMQSLDEHLSNSSNDYQITCFDCLDTTSDVHVAYFDICQYAPVAKCIYPQRNILRSADIAFAKACIQELTCRDTQLQHLKTVEKLEKTPELLYTLTAYLLDYEGSMVNTAKALNCHLNTVKYRLNAVRDYIGCSPTKIPEVYSLIIDVAISRIKDSGCQL